MCNFSVTRSRQLQSFLPKPFVLALFLSLFLVGQVAAAYSTNGRTKNSEIELLLPASLCDDLCSAECHTAINEIFAKNGCYDW